VPLEPRDYVAGYAAIVATAAFGWQVWSTFRAKRPQVTVLMDTWKSSQASAKRRTLDEAKVRIRNREDYAVRVDKLYFYYPTTIFMGGPTPAEILHGDVGQVPFEVPARDIVSLTIRPSQIFRLTSGGNDLTPGVGIELRTGERYGGRPRQ
jgi:hypothetical protein